MKRTQANPLPPGGRKTLIQTALLGSALSLLFVFGFVLLLLAAVTDGRLADAYRKSPNCTGGSPVSAALSPCVFLSEHVVSKRRPEGGVKTLPSYYLTLQNGQPAPQETEITDSRCWNQLAAGDTVTVQIWRGQIMSISAQDCRSRAAKNPLSPSSDDHKILLLLTPLTLFFVIATVFVWKRILRENAVELGSKKSRPVM